MVAQVIDQLSLPRLYQKNPEIIHTSSDGQKFGVAVESIHAPSFISNISVKV